MNPLRLPWLGLAAASLAVGTGLSAAGVPAAILIGPMLVAIAFGVGGVPLRMPRDVFVAAQGVVGCLVAASITPEVLGEVVRDWPGLAFGVLFTIAASTAIGWVSARYGSLPGSTAAWGASPGAASAMVAMAQEYGADPRLVAAMQYIRVICVVLAASFVSRALMVAPPVPLPSHTAAPDPVPLALLATLAVALGGSWLGRRFRVPAGGLMVPLVLGALVNATTPLHLPVPSWLLLVAYTAIGWSIGLQFERTTLLRSLRALPEIVAAAIAIIVLCGLAAFAMVRVMGFDPLTAFLATSPGGIDTVAIIAVSGGADTPFVMALQTLRVLVVIATGPAIARFVARTARRPGRSACSPAQEVEHLAPRGVRVDVEVKILDPRLAGWGFPAWGSDLAAGLDLHACLDAPLVLAPGSAPSLVSAGLAIRIGEPGWCGLVVPRSGLGHRGLVLGNAVGVIDADYEGVIFVSAWNRTAGADARDIVLSPGDRLAQMLFVPAIRPTFVTVESFSTASRRGGGGFGSTGLGELPGRDGPVRP